MVSDGSLQASDFSLCSPAASDCPHALLVLPSVCVRTAPASPATSATQRQCLLLASCRRSLTASCLPCCLLFGTGRKAKARQLTALPRQSPRPLRGAPALSQAGGLRPLLRVLGIRPWSPSGLPELLPDLHVLELQKIFLGAPRPPQACLLPLAPNFCPLLAVVLLVSPLELLTLVYLFSWSLSALGCRSAPRRKASFLWCFPMGPSTQNSV